MTLERIQTNWPLVKQCQQDRADHQHHIPLMIGAFPQRKKEFFKDLKTYKEHKDKDFFTVNNVVEPAQLQQYSIKEKNNFMVRARLHLPSERPTPDELGLGLRENKGTTLR